MKHPKPIRIVSFLFVLVIAYCGCAKQGPAGATGPAGPQGPQGVQGTKGDTGTANVIYSAWNSSLSGVSTISFFCASGYNLNQFAFRWMIIPGAVLGTAYRQDYQYMVDLLKFQP